MTFSTGQVESQMIAVLILSLHALPKPDCDLFYKCFLFSFIGKEISSLLYTHRKLNYAHNSESLKLMYQQQDYQPLKHNSIVFTQIEILHATV